MILPLLLSQIAEQEPVETLLFKAGGIVEVTTEHVSPKDKLLHVKTVQAIRPNNFRVPTTFSLSAHHSMAGDAAVISTIAFPSVNLNKVKYYEVYYVDGKLTHKEFNSSQREAGIQVLKDKVKVDVFASKVPERDYDKVVDYLLKLTQ